MNDKNLKILIAFCAVVAVGFMIFSAYINRELGRIGNEIGKQTPIAKKDLKKFAGTQAFVNKMEEIMKQGYGRGGAWEELALPSVGVSAPNVAKMAEPAAGGDFSKTNVQVEGVDEADIVKTDGKYIYTATKNYITISKAYPAEEAKLASKIDLKSATPQEIFVDGDSLMVFGRRNYPYTQPLPYENRKSGSPIRPEIYPPPYHFTNVAFVEIYDISDRENPELKRKLEFDGDYQTSRKIGSDVYFVLNSYPYYYIMDQLVSVEEKCSSLVPQYREGLDMKSETKTKPIVKCLDVHYIDPIYNANYATIIGISINDYVRDISKEVILGAGENVYASQENIYLAKTDYNYYEAEKQPVSTEKTKIFKFKINGGEIDYKNSGTVAGHILNQFSMDEYNNYFRVATTVGHVSRDIKASSSNNVYILDKDLSVAGSIEDIAPGEQIYSARFMGKRGFLVTFKKVDPFFTLDLSDPKNPKLAGKLKIPGYSDYLHPYDENHIIGIGKNTAEASETLAGTANFAWYQGIKMAMFDVTDYSNPKEMFKIEIGDRGTDSPILSDHKALLFSKDKNLLVIPVLEAKLTDEQKKSNQEKNAYGEYVYQGAYIFSVDLENGFNLRGRVTHFDDESAFKKSGYYFNGGDLSVKRSLYIGDNLYTVSDEKILVNKLESLNKVKEIKFNLPKMPIEP